MVELNKLKFRFPTLPEQQKIAAFLTAVDEKIHLLTKKRDLLEQYKKGVMQQIFNQEIRFKDDNGNDFADWEEQELGDLFHITAGGDVDKDNFSKLKSETFKYPIFSNSEKDKGLFGYSDKHKIEKECITVSGRGALGNAVARFEKFYPIVRLLVLIPKFPSDVIFYENAINQLDFFIESTGVPQLTAPQIANYKINSPTFPEQKKIADFLSAIDAKIKLVNQQVEKTRDFKKGLLQQMFV